jgi:hypothetical protein
MYAKPRMPPAKSTPDRSVAASLLLKFVRRHPLKLARITSLDELVTSIALVNEDALVKVSCSFNDTTMAWPSKFALESLKVAATLFTMLAVWASVAAPKRSYIWSSFTTPHSR